MRKKDRRCLLNSGEKMRNVQLTKSTEQMAEQDIRPPIDQAEYLVKAAGIIWVRNIGGRTIVQKLHKTRYLMSVFSI